MFGLTLYLVYGIATLSYAIFSDLVRFLILYSSVVNFGLPAIYAVDINHAAPGVSQSTRSMPLPLILAAWWDTERLH